MQTDAEVAAIAAGLTKAQRAAMRNASLALLGSLSPDRLKSHPNTCRALVGKGLFRTGSCRWTGRIEYACTASGLRVAQHLKQENAKP